MNMLPSEESVFNHVIKKVKSIPSVLEDQCVVRVNRKTLQVQEKASLFFWGKKFWTYVVGSSETSGHIANGTSKEFEIKDHLTDRGLAIYFKYRLYCPKQNEEKLAQALAGPESPEYYFEKIIDQAIQKAINRDEATFLSHFNQNQSKFTQKIQQTLEKTTGLNIKLTLQIKYQNTLSPIQFSNQIPVRLLNNNNELNIKLFFELSVNNKHKFDAAINFRKEYLLEEKVVEMVSDFFKENITFNEFYYGINDLSLGKLTQSINHYLRHKGREVSILRIEPIVPSHQGNEFESLKYEIESVPHLSDKTVTIVNDLQLKLYDPKKFIESKINRFDAYVEELLRKTIKQQTFGKTYLDFLLYFSSIEENIEMTMKKSLHEIGYDLKQLISGPTLPEMKYLRATPYSYDFSRLPTKSANIFVNFNVSVTYYFSSFNKIKHYLNTNIPVEKEIETEIRNYLETTLNSKAPEDIYMKFSTELEPELIKGIKKILKKFKAKRSGKPVIKQEQTEIGDFVKDLMHESKPFNITLKPVGGFQEFTFNGELSIFSVVADGWDRVSKMNFNFDDILDHFKRALKTKFEALPKDAYLAYDNYQAREFLEHAANKEPVMSVAKLFGIGVQLHNLNRERTALEIGKAKSLEELRQTTIEQDHLAIKSLLEETKADKALMEHLTQEKLNRLKEANKVLAELGYSDEEEDQDQVNKAKEIIKEISQEIDATKKMTKAKITQQIKKRDDSFTDKKKNTLQALTQAFSGSDDNEDHETNETLMNDHVIDIENSQ